MDNGARRRHAVLVQPHLPALPMHEVLRPSTAADAAFIYDLCEVTMKRHAEAVGRKWSVTKMRDKCAHDAADAGTRIIQLEGHDVGAFLFCRREHDFWLDGLYLLPQAQRLGIGSRLVESAKAEALGAGLGIELVVMKANPARAFWERHGFVVTGDDELTFHMSLDPGRTGASFG